MKLIIAIVQDEDAGRLVSALMDKGFGVTKLATTGGFLRAGNTTLISGVEDDKLQDALGVIEKICKSREQITASTTPMGGAGGVYVPYPIRVTVGGATVFVLEVSQFLKVEHDCLCGSCGAVCAHRPTAKRFCAGALCPCLPAHGAGRHGQALCRAALRYGRALPRGE